MSYMFSFETNTCILDRGSRTVNLQLIMHISSLRWANLELITMRVPENSALKTLCSISAYRTRSYFSRASVWKASLLRPAGSPWRSFSFSIGG